MREDRPDAPSNAPAFGHAPGPTPRRARRVGSPICGRRRPGRRWLYLGAVLALAGALLRGGEARPAPGVPHGAVTALWPPVGVGIAALVLFGTRLWPGIVIGDLLVADFSSPLGTVLGQTVGNTLEVVVAAVLLRRLTGRRPAMDRVGDVLALVIAGAVGTGISAIFGATSLRLGDVIGTGEFGRGLADVVAVGLLGRAHRHAAPAVMGGAGPPATRPARGPRGRRPAGRPRAARGGSVPARRPVRRLPGAHLGGAAVRPPRAPRPRFVVVSGLTVWNTAHNAGPFVRESITDSLLSSQLFLAAAALTSLDPRRGHRRAHAGRRRARRQRATAPVRGAVDGRGTRRPRRGGVITDCNAAAEQILGRRRDELRGAAPRVVPRRGGRRERRRDPLPSASSARTRSHPAPRRPASSRACAGPTASIDGWRSAPRPSSAPEAGPRAS